jgi:hypothetical protein
MELNIDKSLLQELGGVAANFSLLEHMIQIATDHFLFGGDARLQPFGRAVTASLSFRQLADLFETSCRLRFPDRDHSDLDKLCKRIRAAQENRSVTMHSLWIGGFDGNAMGPTATARGTLKDRNQNVKVSDVHNLAREIEDTANAVVLFLIRILESPK